MKENLSLQELKDACLLAQKIREDSWFESPNLPRKSYYTLTIEQASKSALKALNISSEWNQIVYLLNLQAWNDIQEVEIPPKQKEQKEGEK